MFKGKCKSALSLLCDQGKGGVLHLNAHIDPEDPNSPSVKEALLQKHPPAQQAPEYIIDEEPQELHHVIFESRMLLSFVLLP